MIEKIECLIYEINKVHLAFSKDYFETGKIEKVNLKHTFSKVPVEHILAYRLNLHESILDKIERFKMRKEGYPVNSILNDIFESYCIK